MSLRRPLIYPVHWRGLRTHLVDDRDVWPRRSPPLFLLIADGMAHARRDTWRSIDTDAPIGPLRWWLRWDYSIDCIAFVVAPVNPATLVLYALNQYRWWFVRRALYPLARLLRRHGICEPAPPGQRIAWWPFFDSVTFNRELRQQRRQTYRRRMVER